MAPVGEHSSLGNEIHLPGSDDSAQDGRGHSLASSADPQGYQPHSDDLFGDMGEMDFGANEVGDADFDYFDEPDDVAAEAEAEVDAGEGDVEISSL